MDFTKNIWAISPPGEGGQSDTPQAAMLLVTPLRQADRTCSVVPTATPLTPTATATQVTATATQVTATATATQATSTATQVTATATQATSVVTRDSTGAATQQAGTGQQSTQTSTDENDTDTGVLAGTGASLDVGTSLNAFPGGTQQASVNAFPSTGTGDSQSSGSNLWMWPAILSACLAGVGAYGGRHTTRRFR